MRAIICIVFFSLAIAGQAQQPLSVEQAVATALANNYEIQISRNDSSLAALNYAYADYAFYPRLNASTGWTFNNSNQQQNFTDGRKIIKSGVASNNLTAALNLNWTLFDGMKMFITKKKLNEVVDLGELRIKSQVVTTVADVMKLYYNIARQQQVLKSIEEQMGLSQERLKLAQYKFDVGTGTKSDVLQAQIDYNAQKSAYLNQQTAILKLKEQLNNLLVMPLTTPFAVEDTIPVVYNLSLDSIQGSVVNSNPQLLLMQKSMDVAELTLEERRAERYPTLSFNSTYNFNRQNNQSVINPIVEPLFRLNRGLNYGVTANIPIFNSYITRRNIQAAQLDIQYLQLQYKQNLAQINTSVTTAYRDYELYRQTLAVEEESVKLVREYLFIARERYRLGVSTFLEMRIAEQNLADAQNRLIQARYNTKVAEIELQRLKGDLVR